jgi:gamma-glutamylcyclotransferase (GGCT)/AIG2-like uncharacterized protein YtfP
MYRVFVYGTLKKGEGNHHLLENSECLGEGYVKGMLCNIHGLPALVEGNNDVPGELYSVDGDTLERLDRLEGYSTAVPLDDCLYDRREVHTYGHFTRDVKSAFVYFWND